MSNFETISTISLDDVTGGTNESYRRYTGAGSVGVDLLVGGKALVTLADGTTHQLSISPMFSRR